MASATLRNIGRVATLKNHRLSPSFSAYRLDGNHLPKMDPLMSIDWFSMGEPYFKPHPHAGFCAVTYIFPESPGSFLNRDSTGRTDQQRPGELYWTTTGSGVLHDEGTFAPGTPSNGLQIFINLPSALKNTPPSVQHLTNDKIPEQALPGGGRVRVLVGQHQGLAAPLELVHPFHLLDIRLPKGAAVCHALPDGWNVSALVVKGEVAVGGEGGGRVRGEQAAELVGQGSVQLEGVGADEGQVILLAGPPTNEVPLWHGPFCGSSMQQIQGWMQDFHAGKMGTLAPR